MAGQQAPQDHYHVLGVADTASRDEIRYASLRLLKSLHPDHNQDPGAHEQTQSVLQAYQVLWDPVQRADYDFHRASQGSGMAINTKLLVALRPAVSVPPGAATWDQLVAGSALTKGVIDAALTVRLQSLLVRIASRLSAAKADKELATAAVSRHALSGYKIGVDWHMQENHETVSLLAEMPRSGGLVLSVIGKSVFDGSGTHWGMVHLPLLNTTFPEPIPLFPVKGAYSCVLSRKLRATMELEAAGHRAPGLALHQLLNTRVGLTYEHQDHTLQVAVKLGSELETHMLELSWRKELGTLCSGSTVGVTLRAGPAGVDDGVGASELELSTSRRWTSHITTHVGTTCTTNSALITKFGFQLLGYTVHVPLLLTSLSEGAGIDWGCLALAVTAPWVHIAAAHAADRMTAYFSAPLALPSTEKPPYNDS